MNERLRRTIASDSVRAALLTLFAAVAIALPLIYAIRRVIREIGSRVQIDRARELLESARTWLIAHQAEMVANWILEGAEQGREFALSSAPSLFGSFFNIVLGIFVCLFVFYYLTKEGASIWKKFMSILPLSGKLKLEVTREVTGILRAIVYGQLLTAIIQGSVAGIGYLIFQVPQPFFLTALTILVAFFPVVGTPLVWAPAGILKLMAGHIGQGIGLLIYGFVLVMNMDNLIRPRLIALHSQVHPVVILIGIIGGTKVFGFIGFLVGPLIFAIFLQLLRSFAEYRSEERQIPAGPAA